MNDNLIFLINENGRPVSVDNLEDAEFVCMDKGKYLGYEKALRILNDRALQNIDRNIADEHGYTLLRAEKTVYKKYEGWRIVKSTPHSLKIDLETAKFLIMQDLRKYYHYIELPELGYNHRIVNGRDCYDWVKINETYLLYEIPRGLNDEYSDRNRKVNEWWASVPDNIIFDVYAISSNIGQGNYEVTYWATDVI